MKRILFLLFAAACAAWAVFDYSKRLDAQLLDHVKKVIPLIAGGWNTKTLEHDAGPELLQNRVALDTTFQFYSQLGKLRYCDNPIITRSAFTTVGGKAWTWLRLCETHSEFEKGQALIDSTWIRQEGQWKIVGLLVKSQQFTSLLSTPRALPLPPSKAPRPPGGYTNPLDKPAH